MDAAQYLVYDIDIYIIGCRLSTAAAVVDRDIFLVLSSGGSSCRDYIRT